MRKCPYRVENTRARSVAKTLFVFFQAVQKCPDARRAQVCGMRRTFVYAAVTHESATQQTDVFQQPA